MDGLLNLESIKTTSHKEEANLTLTAPAFKSSIVNFDNSDDILRTLRSQPDLDTLTCCLEWLYEKPALYDIRIPSPKATQIVNTLARDVLPSYWSVVKHGRGGTRLTRKHFLRCFRSVVGVGALVLRLRELTETSSTNKSAQIIQDTLEVLEAALRGITFVVDLIHDIFELIQKPITCQITWDTFLPYLAGSKTLNAAAAAELHLRGPERSGKASWLSDGTAYSRWLGRNLKACEVELSTHTELKIKARAKLFAKALFLGYRDELIGTVFSGSLEGDAAAIMDDISFLKTLKSTEVKEVMFWLLRLGSRSNGGQSDALFVKGFSALLKQYCNKLDVVPSFLFSWIVEDTAGRVDAALAIRRGVIAALDSHAELLTEACQSLLGRFGDKLYIQSEPILQQEVHVQDLLLMVGHINNSAPEKVKELSQSSAYLNTISNRLGASSPRAAFLGMVFGTAVSELVDAPGKRLNFDDEGLLSEEGLAFKKLIHIYDQPGTLKDLHDATKLQQTPKSKPKPAPTSKPPTSSKPTKPAIIQDSSPSSSDSDIPAYAKPDSDPSDSEDDPTLIDRSKPKPPVYIRDLLRGLRDTENYERYRQALSGSSDLIRRKASFGTEVSEHAEQLAAQLAGAQDTFAMDKFEEHRMQGMIAIVVAQPSAMGKWFSTAVFAGDYSVAQRASMLSALTMAARELAGYREEDAELTGALVAITDTFPSRKRLPAAVEAAYGGPPGFSAHKALPQASQPVSLLADRMRDTLLRPLQASAAETLTPGPASLKLNSVKSRLPARKVRRIDNQLAKVLAESFFHPLCARFRLELGASGSRSPFAAPFLAAHFLRTLGLLLAASGSSTLSLPALVTEFLGLCLWGPVRNAAAKHAPVREALLFCLMALLDTAAGQDRRASERLLVADHAQELLEVQAWCEAVFESTPGPRRELAVGGAKKGPQRREDELEARIGQLSAGVLVRCGEIVERYRHDMLGELARFA